MLIANSTTLHRFIREDWRIVLVVYSIVVGVEVMNNYVRFDRPVFSIAAVGLLMAALAIFLAFRMSEAYARWWEARTLWGTIVNASRDFSRQAISLHKDPEKHRPIVHRQIAWTNALRLTLRKEESWDELAPFLAASELAALEGVANKPAMLLRNQAQRLAEAREGGDLSDFGQLMLDRSMSTLTDAQGGCERIKNTAFPDRVTHFTRAIAWAMAVLLPLGIIEPENSFDLLDVLVVPLMMLTFIMTEKLGAELKNPFEGRTNDTPMSTLCRAIEIDLRQQLDETNPPPPLEPVDGVLM